MTIPRVTKALCSFLQEVCIRCLSRSPSDIEAAIDSLLLCRVLRPGSPLDGDS